VAPNKYYYIHSFSFWLSQITAPARSVASKSKPDREVPICAVCRQRSRSAAAAAGERDVLTAVSVQLAFTAVSAALRHSSSVRCVDAVTRAKSCQSPPAYPRCYGNCRDSSGTITARRVISAGSARRR